MEHGGGTLPDSKARPGPAQIPPGCIRASALRTLSPGAPCLECGRQATSAGARRCWGQARRSHDWTCKRKSLQKTPHSWLAAQASPVFEPCWLTAPPPPHQTSWSREKPSCRIFSEFLTHRTPEPRSWLRFPTTAPGVVCHSRRPQARDVTLELIRGGWGGGSCGPKTGPRSNPQAL